MLPPGGFAVIAANPHAFALRYGTTVPLAGWTLHPFRRSRLSNGGEEITLRSAAGELLFSVEYDDAKSDADGEGHSLEYVPQSDPFRPELATHYQPSLVEGGSPGRDSSSGTQLDYATWASRQANPAVIAAGADPDQDGLTNFAEYACGTHPLMPNSKDVLRIENGGFVDGKRTMFLTFPLNAAARRVQISLETRGRDSSNWSPAGYYLSDSGSYNSSQPASVSRRLTPDGRQIQITVAVPVDMQTGGSQMTRFFRLLMKPY